jgi:hypothetical protein
LQNYKSNLSVDKYTESKDDIDWPKKEVNKRMKDALSTVVTLSLNKYKEDSKERLFVEFLCVLPPRMCMNELSHFYSTIDPTVNT